jgi:hypothetical protein
VREHRTFPPPPEAPGTARGRGRAGGAAPLPGIPVDVAGERPGRTHALVRVQALRWSRVTSCTDGRDHLVTAYDMEEAVGHGGPPISLCRRPIVPGPLAMAPGLICPRCRDAVLGRGAPRRTAFGRWLRRWCRVPCADETLVRRARPTRRP